MKELPHYLGILDVSNSDDHRLSRLFHTNFIPTFRSLHVTPTFYLKMELNSKTSKLNLFGKTYKTGGHINLINPSFLKIKIAKTPQTLNETRKFPRNSLGMFVPFIRATLLIDQKYVHATTPRPPYQYISRESKYPFRLPVLNHLLASVFKRCKQLARDPYKGKKNETKSICFDTVPKYGLVNNIPVPELAHTIFE